MECFFYHSYIEVNNIKGVIIMIVWFLLLVTNLINILFEFFYKSLSILLWAMLLIIFTIPHVFLYNTGKVPNEVLDWAALFALTFNIIYLITRIILNRGIRINFKGTIIDDNKLAEEKQSYVNLYFFIYLLSIGLIFFGLVSNGISLLDFTWSERINYEQSFIERISEFLIIAFSGIGCILLLRGDKSKFLIVVIAFILYVLLTKSRYNILPFIIPFLVYYVYSGKIKKVFNSLLIGCLILFSVFFLQQIRYAGSLKNLFMNQNISDIIGNTFLTIKSGEGEFGLSRVFYYFVQNNNNFEEFGQGLTYIRLLFMPFPSGIVPFKPRDFAMDMWEAWHGITTTSGTMHPTLYGDAFANFGFAGILLGALFACIAKVADILTKSNSELKKILYISILSTMYILIARGAIYNSIANTFWSIVLVNIIILVVNFFIKKRENPKLLSSSKYK